FNNRRPIVAEWDSRIGPFSGTVLKGVPFIQRISRYNFNFHKGVFNTMELKSAAINYDTHGGKYPGHRRTHPTIEEYVDCALRSAKTVLNLGAGAGSSEPEDRYVRAVEPSKELRSQRQKAQRVPAIIGTADSLPFDENSFDASMAMVTVHHWPDIRKGLHEL